MLAPDGLVVGLRLEGIAQKFEKLLEESTIRLATGDVLVFFTDGITEAMNAAADLFGEQRLLSHQVRDRIGDIDPHTVGPEVTERALSGPAWRVPVHVRLVPRGARGLRPGAAGLRRGAGRRSRDPAA